jgi:hypothetical protein
MPTMKQDSLIQDFENLDGVEFDLTSSEEEGDYPLSRVKKARGEPEEIWEGERELLRVCRALVLLTLQVAGRTER